MNRKNYRFVTRCFIALDLPENIISEAKNIQEDIKNHDVIIGNYTKTENIHLTLKFLGEISEREIELVRDALQTIRTRSFDAEIDELGTFSPEFVRIIWLHLSGQDVLDLQSAIDESLKDMFPKENKFQSHITIARVHNVTNKQDLLEYVKGFKMNKTTGKIPSFSLVKSTLTEKGSVFEVLEKYELK